MKDLDVDPPKKELNVLDNGDWRDNVKKMLLDIFQKNNLSLHEAIFIPPTFASNQYTKKSCVAILDYQVKKDIVKLLENLQIHSADHWLTEELKNFMQTQNGSDNIDKNAFDKWIVNLKIMYLVYEEPEKWYKWKPF